ISCGAVHTATKTAARRSLRMYNGSATGVPPSSVDCPRPALAGRANMRRAVSFLQQLAGDFHDLAWLNRPKNASDFRNEWAQVFDAIPHVRHNNCGDAELRKILLVPKLRVGGNEDHETTPYGHAEESTILQAQPS